MTARLIHALTATLDYELIWIAAECSEAITDVVSRIRPAAEAVVSWAGSTLGSLVVQWMVSVAGGQ